MVPTLISGSGSPSCCHLCVSAPGNNAKVFNWLVLRMFTAQKMHNFLCRRHKILHLPRPKKNVIFDSNFNSKKWILHLLRSKCTWCLPVHCFCTVFKGGGYEGDGRVMSHNLGHEKCRIKVFVMFCYLGGKNGSLSRFEIVEPGLGNFSKYRGIQQQPNIQSVFHKCWRKKWPRLGTKSSNRILCFFLGTPIHVEILW